MRKEVLLATVWGIVFTAVLAALIIIGSRNLSHFDAPLVGYTFAILFSTFGIVYRYSMWLQRPPTAMYWKRGWQVFFNPGFFIPNIVNWFKRVFIEIGFNTFIFRRGGSRGLAHLLLFWGVTLAALITFPLVFGWIHFESVPGKIDWYTVYLFGFPTFSFPVHSLIAFFTFHGLVWSALLVIAGVMLAMRRRMRDEGAAAFIVCDQLKRHSVDCQLYMDERVCVRFSFHPSCSDSNLHASLATIRKIFPHISTPRTTWCELLQGCWKQVRTGEL
jgi:hypothetical protein